MFDDCGKVLGVLWAGGPDANFSHSSAAVHAALARMTPARPPLPEQVPEFLQGDGRLIWHYGAEPPPLVDCSGHDGDRWVGVIEERVGDLQYGLDRVGKSASPCAWRHVAAIGWTGDVSSTYLPSDKASCVPRVSMDDPGEAISAELGEWDRSVGRFRLRTVTHPIVCIREFNYSLLFNVAESIDNDVEMRAVLVGTDGQTLPSLSSGLRRWQASSEPASRIARISQDWEAPPGFQPVAVQVTVWSYRGGPVLLSETLPFDDEARVAAGSSLSLSLRIAARIDPQSGAVRACIQRPGEALDCPERGLPAAAPGDRSWRRTSPLSWLEDVPEDLVPESRAARPDLALTACAIDPALPARA